MYYNSFNSNLWTQAGSGTLSSKTNASQLHTRTSSISFTSSISTLPLDRPQEGTMRTRERLKRKYGLLKRTIYWECLWLKMVRETGQRSLKNWPIEEENSADRDGTIIWGMEWLRRDGRLMRSGCWYWGSSPMEPSGPPSPNTSLEGLTIPSRTIGTARWETRRVSWSKRSKPYCRMLTSLNCCLCTRRNCWAFWRQRREEKWLLRWTARRSRWVRDARRLLSSSIRSRQSSS